MLVEPLTFEQLLELVKWAGAIAIALAFVWPTKKGG